jgi:Flp pilus assembly protein CpaB
MRSFDQRRSTVPRPAASIVLTAVLVSVAVALAVLWGLGVIDVSKFRTAQASTAGLVAVPTAARTIPAYTKITRDHLWDPTNGRLTFVHLAPNSVTKEMLINFSDIIGRVIDHEKPAGYVFTETDFLPRGTREGIVAGIPPGKRAIRVPADKVEGLYGLRPGDRFDLVATLAIDGGRGGAQSFNFGGVYGQQIALQARLSNWQKQATVRVMVQDGTVVEPLTTRQVPVFSNTLTQGGITRMRPVQEIVIAVDPEEVAPLTEAMAVDAKISTVPRSGRPDDPIDSKTPGLRPVSPFTGVGSGGFTGATSESSSQTAGAAPFAVVETIMGPKRELTAVPKQ